ncbi:glycerate kinase [Streptomyces hydrogenans]|uniref:glycerate kinase n=1 Tax=Streptomyces hydrogenans TaxID=1873719 RepID=UPI00355889D3
MGELIRAALDAGARRVLVGCGDSGTSDGRSGLRSRPSAPGSWTPRESNSPWGVPRLNRLDGSTRPASTRVSRPPSCWWPAIRNNVLRGERGVARVFGPQKGAARSGSRSWRPP